MSYVPSNLRVTFDGSGTETDANLLLGTVRATFHAIPMTSLVWLSLNGGVSMIRRGMLSFYVVAEDYIYGARPERRPDRLRLRVPRRALRSRSRGPDLVGMKPAIKLFRSSARPSHTSSAGDK